MDQPTELSDSAPRPLIAAHKDFARHLDALALLLRPLVDEASALRAARDRAYRAAMGTSGRASWARSGEAAFLDAVMGAGSLDLRLWELEELVGAIVEPQSVGARP